MKEFNHLILLIGTNPLPNFVVADYFLRNNRNIQSIWLIHSEENRLQAGTYEQAKNLEMLLQKRWQKHHANLRFPLEKISLTDVSDAGTILREIETKMLKGWQSNQSFHLNYTGGTKAMAIHVCKRMQDFQKLGHHQFSYLDANNFRLVVDEFGVVVDDLRKEVKLTFNELISLHGFQKVKAKNGNLNDSLAFQTFKKFLDDQSYSKMETKDGYDFENYIFLKLSEKFKSRLTNGGEIQSNWLIKYPTWQVYFELDIILLNGYHLAGISCTVSADKHACKSRGFEVILRTRQIGGDEARAILITRSNRNQTRILQDELVYETGENQQNILVLGVDDLRQEEIYLRKIEKFVFD